MMTLGIAASLVLAAVSSPETSTWKQPLVVAECVDIPLELPLEAEAALDATLLVSVQDGTGSAVFVSPDGFALTAAHVVGTNEVAQVTTKSGEEFSADVVRVNVAHDVAMLHIDTGAPTACLPLRTEKATLGSDVFLLGSPAGQELSFSVSKGIVSGYRSFNGAGFVQLDASVNPGNSGGPAVSADGEVVGIASWKVSHVTMEGLAFAVPAGTVGRALGVRWGEETDPEWRDLMGVAGVSPPAASGVNRVGNPDPVEPFSADRIRRSNAKRSLYIGGGVALGLGILPIVGTAIAYRKQDQMTERRWNVVKGFNTAGWAISIAGAAAVVTGLAIPKRRRSERRERAAHARWSGSAVSGRF